MNIEIILNGKTHQLSESQSIAEFIATLNLSDQAIAVAVNRTIIARQCWNDYQVQAKDQIDVVRAIGGG
ncbi:MAG: thiS1 [Solimicrobium sp.]|jgi:sulfur carrier protein|nr:thiS1 [Solimicrobium sp.]